MLLRSLDLLGRRSVEAPTLAGLEAVVAAGDFDVVLLDWSLAGDDGPGLVGLFKQR